MIYELKCFVGNIQTFVKREFRISFIFNEWKFYTPNITLMMEKCKILKEKNFHLKSARMFAYKNHFPKYTQKIENFTFFSFDLNPQKIRIE